MRFVWAVVLAAAAAAWGQSVSAGNWASTGTAAWGAAACGTPNNPCMSASVQLPQNWANNHECDPPGGTFNVTKTLGTDFTGNAAGINAAISAWASDPDEWYLLQIPVGTYNTSSPLPITSQVTLLGKARATKCFVIRGTGTITPNQTLCSHKTIDNSDGSSPRNLGCTNDIAQLATLEGNWNPGNNGLIFTACTIGNTGCSVGPNHYAFENLEMRPIASSAVGLFLVQLKDGDTTGSLGSNRIWFIQDYMHGDATDSGVGNNLITAMVNFTSCSYCGLAYDYFDKCASNGNESHIIDLIWSPGPLKMVHNWLEGCSIPFIPGGSTNSPVLPYENVSDWEIRGNRFTKPPAWMTISGGGLVLKNTGELKIGTRILFDGNIFEYSSTNGGQSGQCMTFDVRNTAGGFLGDNYANQIVDINFTNNICRHAVVGILMAPRSSSGGGNGGGAAQPIRRMFVNNDLFYDIAPGTSIIYNNSVGSPWIIQGGANGNQWICTAAENSAGTAATLTCADGGTGLHQTTMSPGDLVASGYLQ